MGCLATPMERLRPTMICAETCDEQKRFAGETEGKRNQAWPHRQPRAAVNAYRSRQVFLTIPNDESLDPSQKSAVLAFNPRPK